MNSTRFFQTKAWCLATVLLVMLHASGSDQEEARVGRPSQTESITTHCVGRYLIDLPSSFSISSVTTGTFTAEGSSADDPVFDTIVREGPFARSQFAAQIQKRRIEIKSKGDDTTDILRAERTLSDDAVLFRIQRIDDAYESEIHFLRGTSLVIARIESYENQFLSAEEALINFAARVKENDGKTAHLSAQGFCLGAVVVTGEFKYEVGSFLFRDGMGIDFGVDISTASQRDAPLLSRMSAPDSLLAKFNVRHQVLRARKRNVAGLSAEEWLGWAKLGEQEDEKSFGFALEMISPTPRQKNLTLSFESAQPLEDGTPTKTQLSDEEAMQLWDSIVQSIRQAKS